MGSALHVLADLGAASVGAVWAPVLAWTALALAVDAALRAGRASAPVGLWTRGALVAALPALLAVPPVLARWVPSVRAADGVDAVAAPPSLEVASRAGWAPVETAAFVAAPPPLLDVALGVAVLAAALAGLVALGVVVGGAGWLGRACRRLRPAPGLVQAEADRLAARFGLRRPPAVVVAGPGSAPFTVGWVRPVVAVPPDLGGEPLRLALAHEIAHVRASHYGWALAERAVRAAFVWHPLVHGLGRALALDRERAADAAVLGLWPDRARPYGRLLAAFATRPSPALALGASSSSLVHRLAAMARPRPDRRRLAYALGVAVLAVPVWLAAAAVPDTVPAVGRADSGAPSPVATLADGPTEADTLDQHVVSRRAEHGDRGFRLEIQLRPGTPRAVAVAVADYHSAGDHRGDLAVRYDGGTVDRTTLRYPPPPISAEATPPPRSHGDLSDDDLDAYIAKRIGSYSDRGNRVEICLEPGASRAVAERVADHYADGDWPGALVVTFDGGRVTRSTSRRGGLPPPPSWPAKFMGPGWPEASPFTDVIGGHRAEYETGQPHIQIRLAAGEPRDTAERVAGYYADGEHPGRLVVAFDGGQIERSTLRGDGLPAPTPQSCR